jgi:small-conductance mechanosensitive channel/CRP-like cAMP-binding protein
VGETTVHPQLHFFWTLGFLAVIAAATVVVRPRQARRRLFFSEGLLLAALGVHSAILFLPSPGILKDPNGQNIENLLVSSGLIAAAVTLFLNPWFREREDRGTPAIVQDTVIAALAVIAAMVVFQNSSFLLTVTGSAIVVGLALQDTLGNVFAGLAIQLDKPFRVGHWISATNFEGRVAQVTWRATKIRTKSGNLVVLPNSLVAKEAINNYSEPTAPTRLSLDVGVSYVTPPNETRDALLTAMGRVTRVLASPKADALLVDFAASALTYRVRFWVDDFERDDAICSEVRIAIYYELHRRGIEIPYPIQVEYQREEAPRDSPAIRHSYAREIASVPVLAGLGEEAHAALARAASERLYADGETIVSEGDAGSSMFIVRGGAVVITVEPDAREVAVTQAGGYFGEMSLLTGQPRSATVTARGDCRVLQIAADEFRAYVQSHPEVIDQMAASAALRQKELDETRAMAGPGATAERVTLVRRMRRFFGLE